uniref:Uncharacterized protein n=1 Tax=Arundo donax TaxID=35708 RepID=A0A0A9GF70_ARUDO
MRRAEGSAEAAQNPRAGAPRRHASGVICRVVLGETSSAGDIDFSFRLTHRVYL